jgi:hypothetical protein
MPEPKTSTSLYLLPGMQAKFTAPRYFVAHGERKILNEEGNYESRTLIHDHSSIVAGGPAYGTYFTDDETT